MSMNVLMAKSLSAPSISLPIQRKIQLANSLYTTWHEDLQGAPQIHRLLERLRQGIDTTRETMYALGILDMCKHCDEEKGGSCCGRGIENKYDTVLLLINLLLGTSLPEQRCDANSCYFLNKNGCMLKARHVLCVNYICASIEQELTTDEIIRLQQVAGKELDLLFILYETVKKIISNNTNDQRVLKGNGPDHQFL